MPLQWLCSALSANAISPFGPAAWSLLAVSRLIEIYGAAKPIPARYLPALEQSTFVIAIGLSAVAVFLYIRERNLLAPLAAVTACTAGFAVARVVLWPDSLPLRFALEVAYRIILLTAAIALVRARRGRREPATGLLAILLLTQHLNWPLLTSQIPAGIFALTQTLLGVTMLLFVFREARARTQRLTALHALTGSIILAQQQGGMMDKALEALQQLTKSKSAWFRLIEGGHLVATHAVGVSPDFLREVGIAELSQNISQLLEHGQPVTVRRNESIPEDPQLLSRKRFAICSWCPSSEKNRP